MGGKSIFKRLRSGYRSTLKKEEEKKPQIIVQSAVEADKKKEEEKKPKFKGIEIPDFVSKRVRDIRIRKAGEEEEAKISLSYPLIPNKPAQGEKVKAYASIVWNPQGNRYEYQVVEPQMTKKIQELLTKIKDMLEEKLDIDFTKLKKKEASDYLQKHTFELLDYFGIKLTENERETMKYYIDRDFLGVGALEPLMHDPEIEEVSCDGVGIPIFIFHRNPLISSVQTNVVFNDAEQLDLFLVRLAQLCGQAISVVDPLLGGTLPDGSRIQGTLATDIAKRGSNFTIRKFTAEPFTPIHLLNYETIDIKTLAYLWMAVDYGNSVLVSGGTATGKTVFLNVLSLFIRPEKKIVSIEDTHELKLPHPHWVPQVARVSISTEVGKSRGEVDLFDLLKESLRQRPDYIIVGEVRGKEAYVLFQQMATGHPSLATIHADSIEKLEDRLVTPPISLPPSLIESLDLVVFLTKMRYRGKHVRKVDKIHEIIGFDLENNKPKVNQVVEWDAGTNQIKTVNKSVILEKIIKKTGMREEQVVNELKRRMLVLYWMQQRNLTNYRDVAEVINAYYNYPDRVLETISGEI